jgi:hypothetical protein
LVQKILKRPGCAISPIASTADAVPFELPSARPDSMASITCCALANLSASDLDPRFLEVALLDGDEERQPRRDRPKADAQLGTGLRAYTRRGSRRQRRSGGDDERAAGQALKLCRRAQLRARVAFRSEVMSAPFECKRGDRAPSLAM